MSSSGRIASLDILRGIVMVVMALDHSRDYFHLGAFAWNDPTNLETTTPFLFFTRFITHYCAPVFVFLAGTSAYLYGIKTSTETLAKFLLTRGLWLIFVELIIMNFLWSFDINYSFNVLGVIWAIGISMMILSFLIYVPIKSLALICIAVIAGHNALDSFQMEGLGIASLLWYILHQSTILQFSPDFMVLVGYPIIPWFAIMALGYCFGTLYNVDFPSARRKRYLLIGGMISIALFFVLRAFNIYGDASEWESQKNIAFTVISFFNVTKYPPSLLYLLITLGPAMLVLAILEKARGTITAFFRVFGSVPFFYYVLHVFVLHMFALLGLIVLGENFDVMLFGTDTESWKALDSYGYELWVTYVMWIATVLLLYPLCKQYMKYKHNNKHKWWLGYL